MRILPYNYYIPTIKGLLKNFLRGKSIYPFYASFKITSRCHFRCTFCNMGKDKTADLPTNKIIKILDNLSRSSILMTSFEGGEPLLREDIGVLLEYARKCKFYLLFTTSARNILKYPMEKYSKHIDFLHVSIDEGHDNLEMFDLLPDLVKLKTQVSVQTVVTKDTVAYLDSKVEQCYKNGANIVIIPAAPMEGAEYCFPDIEELEMKMNYLNKKFPYTIHTPLGYFEAYKKQKCSSAAIVIAPDGYIYYPCHILEKKGQDLSITDLTTWLTSEEADKGRLLMKECSRNCGWYQYYSIDSYTSPLKVLSALRPVIHKG